MTTTSAQRVRANLPPHNPGKMVDEIDWSDQQQVKWLKALVSERCPEGLSQYARHVAGYNYFKVVGKGGHQEHLRCMPMRWKKGVAWTSGIVDWGPHREMLKAFLSPDHYTIVCSRDSFKTHMAMAWIAQSISLNRDQSWLIYMQTLDQAQKTVQGIRNILESKASKDLFGDFKGDSTHWKTDSFTVCGRTNPGERNPTVSAAGVDKFVTGSHCDMLYVDDPVGPQTVRSGDQIEKAIDGYKYLQPLCNPGHKKKVTITPYKSGDFCDWILSKGRHQTLFIPCGMLAKVDDSGAEVLTGWPAFPHLDEPYLEEALGSMDVESFNRQYGLCLEDTVGRHFNREDFVGATWDDRMARMSAYLMCDTATSTQHGACQTVLAIVLLDWEGTAYVADMEIGRWKSSEVKDRIFGMMAKWQPKVHFCGVTMERAVMNDVYRGWLEQEAARLGIRLNLIDIPRGGASQSDKQPIHKQNRIAGLESVIKSHRLRFLDTLPREFVEDGKRKTLYNPIGHQAPGQIPQPSGVIVDHFLQWRPNPNYKGPRDIADCLADLHAVGSDGNRLLRLPSRGFAAPDAAPRRTQSKHRELLRTNYWQRMHTKAR